jgi:glycosyltransferase involved in cell wall biosynthesis
MAAALGVAERVRFHSGYIPNEAVGGYFGAADVLVQPNLEATQSAVVALAVHFGVPVIASRVGGLPDAVRDGTSGLLVPPGDADALAAAITRVFTEPDLLGRLRGGMADARQDFGWDAQVQLIESLVP